MILILIQTFLNGGAGDLSKIVASDNIETFEPWKYDELSTLAEQYLEEKEKTSKSFYMSAYHYLKYIKQTAEGNVPLDTSVTNDQGKYYQPEATNQYEFEDSLDIGLGVKVHKALDLVFSLVAKNEDGFVGSNGTTWEFGNVAFRFHPERIKNKTGVRVRMDGSVISSGLPIGGKNVTISGDTNDGGIGVTVNGTTVGYDKDTGIVFQQNGIGYTDGQMSLGQAAGKYFIGIGKLSLNFSDYTLQLSDCKAVMLGYKDNLEGLTFVYAKPQSESEGTDSSEGTYERFITAAQYITKRLIPSMELSFNFATAKDHGNLVTPQWCY